MRRILTNPTKFMGFLRTNEEVNFQKEISNMDENRWDDGKLFKLVAASTIGLIVVGMIVYFSGIGGAF
jgi:hypothetical protein